MTEHECPKNPHLPCFECGGRPDCGCPDGECPEDPVDLSAVYRARRRMSDSYSPGTVYEEDE